MRLSPNSKIQSLCSLKCCFMTNDFTKALLSCAAMLNLPDNSRAEHENMNICSPPPSITVLATAWPPGLTLSKNIEKLQIIGRS